jgi:hypothetical protein
MLLQVSQHPICMNTASFPTDIHPILGTLTPLSNHCKEAISYLVSIYSPLHALQSPSLPNWGLNSQCLVWGSLFMMVWPQSSDKAAWGRYGITVTHSHSTSHLYCSSWFLLSMDGEPSPPIRKPPVANEFPTTRYILHSGCKTNRTSAL